MTLESPYLSAFPCRLDTHSYEVGMLVGATNGGQVYTWTSRQDVLQQKKKNYALSFYVIHYNENETLNRFCFQTFHVTIKVLSNMLSTYPSIDQT